MKYDSITEIDIHGMRAEEAVKALGRIIEEAPYNGTIRLDK